MPPGMFKCVARCGRMFDREPSLTYHQNSCGIYAEEQTKIRVEMQERARAARQAQERRRAEIRNLQPQAHKASVTSTLQLDSIQVLFWCICLLILVAT
jgi:hypothetical protein